jgi:hypothetical protein
MGLTHTQSKFNLSHAQSKFNLSFAQSKFNLTHVTPTIPSLSGGYSAAAEVVFAKMPNPLTTTEKDRIAACIDYAVTLGIYNDSDVSTAFDYFTAYFLDDPDNALVSWFGTKTSTAVNSPTHVPGQGYLFNKTNYIDDNFNMLTESVNASQNDNYTACHVYVNNDTGTGGIFGVNAATRHYVYQDGLVLGFIVNGLTGRTTLIAGDAAAGNTYSIYRVESTTQYSQINGVDAGSGGKISQPFLSYSQYTGGLNAGTLQLPLAFGSSFKAWGKGTERTNINLFLNKVKTEFGL